MLCCGIVCLYCRAFACCVFVDLCVLVVWLLLNLDLLLFS